MVTGQAPVTLESKHIPGKTYIGASSTVYIHRPCRKTLKVRASCTTHRVYCSTISNWRAKATWTEFHNFIRTYKYQRATKYASMAARRSRHDKSFSKWEGVVTRDTVCHKTCAIISSIACTRKPGTGKHITTCIIL